MATRDGMRRANEILDAIPASECEMWGFYHYGALISVHQRQVSARVAARDHRREWQYPARAYRVLRVRVLPVAPARTEPK